MEVIYLKKNVLQKFTERQHFGPGTGSGWIGLRCKTPVGDEHLEDMLEEGRRNGWGATTWGTTT